MSPERIRRDIVDQLYWDGAVDDSNISIAVSDGAVTLSGTVSSNTARQAAWRDAWIVPGVKRVDNQLRIEYEPAGGIPSDKELWSGVKNLLAWNPSLAASDFDVQVRDRVVTIRGDVDSFWRKRLARDLAYNVRGVIDVKDEIAVVPSDTILDHEIADNIVASLDRSISVDANDINLKVEHGKVSVDGTVPSYQAFETVEKIISGTPGITEFINNIKVENREPMFARNE